MNGHELAELYNQNIENHSPQAEYYSKSNEDYVLRARYFTKKGLQKLKQNGYEVNYCEAHTHTGKPLVAIRIGEKQ